MKRLNRWLALVFVLLLSSGGRLAVAESFAEWKADFIQRAKSQGVSPDLLSRFQAIAPYPKAVSSDKNQAEFKKFLWDYLKSALSASRIATGQRKFKNNQALFQRIGLSSGVSPQIIAAIWGMETSYGYSTGSVPVMRSMATLAHEGRRRAFFENELLTALQLIEQGDLPDLQILGSWAGGLGMTQFIPSSYQKYAVDYNGDGVRNLWQTADALASTANYLVKMGWQAGYRWGREVAVINDFDYSLANQRKDWKPLSTWKALGVTGTDGTPLPDDAVVARLLVPAGQFGPKFLLYKNFDIIKRYNNSDAYALGVALLSERIAGHPGLQTSWPTNAKKMTANDVKIVQTALNAYGYNAGRVDGVFGNATRNALQAYQAANGLVADGFLTVDLYRRLITERP